jgi:hypothetical protein
MKKIFRIRRSPLWPAAPDTIQASARCTAPLRALLCALAALIASPAFANGSMQCEGRPYSAEVQFRLSTGELTEVVIARTDSTQPATERFALRHRFVDYKRQHMRITGTSLESPSRKLTLNVSKARGTLSYAGAQRRLRCDWNNLG